MDNCTFNGCIKYYCQNPYENFDYATYVDKHKVKEVVKSIINISKEYIYFTSAKEIDEYNFDTLPDLFVIKATHGCGWNIIVENNFNRESAIAEMKNWLNQRYRIVEEKQYAQVEPGIIIEEYLGGNIEDFKFYMFNGSMEFIQFDVDRFSNHRQNYYDKNWNLMPFTRVYPNDLITKYDKPDNFEEMINVVYLLTERINNPPFVRVDIYNINNKLYFGEYTFTPAGGNSKIKPEEYEKKYGELLKL